jgi:hypothetical protein
MKSPINILNLVLTIIVSSTVLLSCNNEEDPLVAEPIEVGTIEAKMGESAYTWSSATAQLEYYGSGTNKNIRFGCSKNSGSGWVGSMFLESGPYTGPGTYTLGTAAFFDGAFYISTSTDLIIDEEPISPSSFTITKEENGAIEGTFSLTLPNYTPKVEGRFFVKVDR